MKQTLQSFLSLLMCLIIISACVPIEELLDQNSEDEAEVEEELDDDEVVLYPQLTLEQKKRAEQLTSLFENGTIEIKYNVCEEIHDGRGFTCGRAGFTSATGDLLEVVKRYTAKRPSNPLASYLSALKILAAEESDSVIELIGLDNAWASASNDPLFRAVQDSVVDELYFIPSQQYADELGLETALARAVLYDTIIQHGDGDDPDSIAVLITRTGIRAGGTPAEGINEEVWLDHFLTLRRATLANAYDPETRVAWAESVGRCDVFRAMLEDGNFALHGPIHINTEEYDEVIP